MALNITTGQMRSTAILQNNQPVSDGAGGQLDSFVDTCTMRGRLRQRSGSRSDEQGDLVISQKYEFVTRAQNGIIVNSDSQLVIDGVKYRVETFNKVDEIEHYFIFIISKCLTDLP